MKTNNILKRVIIISGLLLLTIGLMVGVPGITTAQEADDTLTGQALPGNSITYQGRLTDAGSPANGTFDFEFTLFDAASGGFNIGNVVTKDDVTVSEGLFLVELDFGEDAFNGEARYLEIMVRPGNSSGIFTILSPRQPVAPTPYALALPGLRTEQNDTSPNVIGGHRSNNIAANVVGATIGGGGPKVAFATISNFIGGNYATIGGGEGNRVNGVRATIGGGSGNEANGAGATTGGGFGNVAGERTATIAGGEDNEASGNGAAIGGGTDNVASGINATVPGGSDNAARGNDSFAAGSNAIVDANHSGTILFADGSSFPTPPFNSHPFNSTAANEFAARATGGVRFVTAIDSSTGTPTAGVTLSAGGSAWAALSDRQSKENIEAVDGQAVLAKLAEVPIATWNYKTQAESIRHMGPMAQDFRAAFGLGEDETRITTIDSDGVALAAIQGLYEVVQAQEAQLAAQQALIEQLQTRLAALEAAGEEVR